MPSDIAIIILAAGSSSRLGKPKQLLRYKNTTLVQHAIETAKAIGCKNIIVITGAAHENVSAGVDQTAVTVVENEDWQSGMASSICAGIRYLQGTKNVKGALIMLCDQPLISTQHLNKLIADSVSSPHKIIATQYADIKGVPAVFPAQMFGELLNLTGDQGARRFIIAHEKEVISVPFEGATLDIDTAQDYQKLLDN